MGNQGEKGKFRERLAIAYRSSYSKSRDIFRRWSSQHTAGSKQGWQTAVLPFSEINGNSGKLSFPSVFRLVC